MGYFVNGFAFTSAPDWSAVSDAMPPSIALKGYQHKETAIWLLDAWTPSKREHWPFTEPFPERRPFLSGAPQASIDLLATLSNISAALSESSTCTLWLQNAARLAAVASADTFFFISDDDETDVACRATARGITHFRVRFGQCSADYSPSGMFIVPFQSDEDPELGLSTDVINELARIPGVTVAPVRKIEGGFQLHESAVLLWPVGDAGNLLGIGTWDSVENIKDDYIVCYERMSAKASVPVPPSTAPMASAKSKAWWQFWR